MKKLLSFIAMSAALLVSCNKNNSQQSEAEQPTAAESLISRLDSLRGQGIMYAHQDDPFYGISWKWEQDRSDTKELVGDYPAVMGFDLGGLEMGDQKNLDSVPFSQIREEAIKQVERGGIITFSWHPRNPLTGGNAWDVTDSTVVRNLLDGGDLHEKFCGWTDSVANFLCTMQLSDGSPVPFILRPWHEYNGSWFWWGQNLCSDAEFKGLWNLFQDRINARLSNNVVWSFSPNLQGGWNDDQFLKRYPGDERVDLLGEDCYQWGSEEDFISQTTADVQFLSAFAQQHGLLFAITECGIKNSPVADWWSRVFLPCIEQAQPCYFLPWRNCEAEHFGPAKETATADDFRQLVESGRVKLVQDIQ